MERRKAVFRPEGSIKGSIPGAQWRSCKSIRREKPRRAGLLQSPLTDSNRRPPPYHGGALPTELRGRVREDGSRDEGPRGIRRLPRLPDLVPVRRRPEYRGDAVTCTARRPGVDAQLLRAARRARRRAAGRALRPDRLRQV